VTSPTDIHLLVPTDVIAFRPWTDALIDSIGHDVRSTYVERFWLAPLGPAAVLILRRTADEFDRHPDGFEVPVGNFAQWMGFHFHPGRHSVLFHTIRRLTRFGTAKVEGGHTLAVRRFLPTLTARQRSRLTPELRVEHDQWLAGRPRPNSHHDQRARLRLLAQTLLANGDEPALVERQLHQWGAHPALAHEAIRWARQAS